MNSHHPVGGDAGSFREWIPWPVAALVALCVVQGMAGRPAPPGVRWVESLIAALAVIAIGWRQPWDLALGRHLRSDRPDWVRQGAACLFILIWIPGLRGAMAGWPIEDVVRDLVPLGFLFLPLVLTPVIESHAATLAPWLTAALTFEGVALSIRWWRHADWGFGAVGVRALADGGGYLLNAPSVLFAAIVLPIVTLRLALAPGWWRKSAAAMTALGGVICGAALLGAVHRLAVALMVVGGVLAIVTESRRRRGVMLALGLAAAVVMLGPPGDRVMDALAHVAEKTRLAGENGRLAEAEAALSLVGTDLPSALLGHGWGALIENPAVGGWRVSYTHSVVTYILVKAGVIGLVALTAWMASLAPAAGVGWRRDPAMAFAILAPLITAFTLHTSYKYLDTGLLLTLLVAVTYFKVDKINDYMRIRVV